METSDDYYIIAFKVIFDGNNPNKRKYFNKIKAVNPDIIPSWPNHLINETPIHYGELNQINEIKYVLYGQVFKRVINGLNPGIPGRRNATDLHVDLELDSGFLFRFATWFDKSRLDFKNSIILLKNVFAKEGLPEPPDLTYLWNDWVKSTALFNGDSHKFPKITPEAIRKWAIEKKSQFDVDSKPSVQDKRKIQGNKKVSITQFEQLFKPEYQDKIEQFIDIFRIDFSDKESALINTSNEWIGGNKSAAKVFYNVLLAKGVVNKATNKELGQLFDQKFKGLGTYFADSNIGYGADQYREHFNLAVSKLLM
jgi:hypothetical protein